MADRVLGVAEANTAAERWCAEVNAVVHSETCAVPDARLVEERGLLAPLPSLRLQLGPEPVTRKVDRLSCVRFASARYSVPTRLIGARVILRPDAGRLQVIDPGTGEIVARACVGRARRGVRAGRPLRRPTPGPEPGPATENRCRATVLQHRPSRRGVPGRGR